MTSRPYLTLTLICLCWLLSLITFQWFAEARLGALNRPDRALEWTESATGENARSNKYHDERFLHRHVTWDSGIYLSIATAGYDDPIADPVNVNGETYTINYAFFPLYPLLMRWLSVPLRLFELNDIATASLAGIIISALGALGGMIALYDITKAQLGEQGALRTAFYMLIFPSSMFFAQVYTEGLFAGLSFGAIALARRKKWGWAAILAILATWTRPVGLLLFIILCGRWMISYGRNLKSISIKQIGELALCFAPLVAYAIWKLSPLGQGSDVVQSNFFYRDAFQFNKSFDLWRDAAGTLTGENSQRAAFYWAEFISMFIALGACFVVAKRYPTIALFSLFAIAIPLFSGSPQGMLRYVLAAPALFIALGMGGRNPVFDRIYTTVGITFMALFATLFTFDFWVG